MILIYAVENHVARHRAKVNAVAVGCRNAGCTDTLVALVSLIA